MKLSPEERQRRSNRARAQHAAGKLGAKAKAKRMHAELAPVRQRPGSPAALAQDMAVRHAEAIENALVGVLRRGSTAQKLKASELLLKVGLAGERQQNEDAHEQIAQMTRAEMLDALRQQLAGPMGGVMRSLLAEQTETVQVIDATAEEISSAGVARD
jgi:hypothetical protein